MADKAISSPRRVDALADLVTGLADRKTDITNGVAYTNAAAGSIADLLAQARPPLQKVVHETDRAAGIVVADHDYFDNLLNTLPGRVPGARPPGYLRRLLQLLSVRPGAQAQR